MNPNQRQGRGQSQSSWPDGDESGWNQVVRRGKRGGGQKRGGISRTNNRRGGGGSGDPVSIGPRSVKANFFKINIVKDMSVSKYTVSLLRKRVKNAEEVPKEFARYAPIPHNRKVFEVAQKSWADNFQCFLAYDGRSVAYSTQRERDGFDIPSILCDSTGTQVTDRDGAQFETSIIIQYERDLDINQADSPDAESGDVQEQIRALNILLAHGVRKNMAQLGRSFYFREDSKTSPTSIWQGFYQSVRHSQDGLKLNVTPSYRAFWQFGGEKLSDLVIVWLRQRYRRLQLPHMHDIADITNQDLKMALTDLQGLKVRSTHIDRVYTVRGHTDSSAAEEIFMHGGLETSVRDYFKNTYDKTLQHSNLVCVQTGRDRQTCVPIELLTVLEDQAVTGRHLQDLTRELVRVASKPPMETQTTIASSISQITESLRHETSLHAFLTIDTEMEELEASVLQAPKILFSANQTESPKGGSWTIPNRANLIKCAALPSWTILLDKSAEDMLSRDNVVTQFRRGLLTALSSLGLNASAPLDPASCDDGALVTEMRNTIVRFQNRGAPLSLVVLLSGSMDGRKYNEVKLLGDTVYGVPTQVCLASNVGKHSGVKMSSYARNVALKINAKLGGKNWVACPHSQEISSSPGSVLENFLRRNACLVLGADVTHPGVGESGCSVAALVGSMDPESVQFSASIKSQQGRQEMMEHLQEMFTDVYKNWQRSRGRNIKLKTIIMFRDGVSEGQYDAVKQTEIAKIENALTMIFPRQGTRPSLTYIIVTKRHHARFFDMPTRSAGNGNIPPGTVINSNVTNSGYVNFYLCSHAVPKGTGKPAKYSVLQDDNNFSEAELFDLVMILAHGYARCTRSVSMVSSAYYAHLLAYRARSYLSEVQDDDGNMDRRLPDIHEALSDRIFYA